ncbi:hypothetical protein HZ326_14257 [Fusarium oxysporum f. sp. albedinis]|nr:hypothetical protein HZ326_14257 [Fusarium oxysporum f. sp. albedinis]
MLRTAYHLRYRRHKRNLCHPTQALNSHLSTNHHATISYHRCKTSQVYHFQLYSLLTKVVPTNASVKSSM